MENNKTVVIVESSASDTPTKIAQNLKKNGFKTVLITIIGGIELNFLKESYDHIISFNLKFFKTNIKSMPKIIIYVIRKIPSIIKVIYSINGIKKIKPDFVIARATPNWLCWLAKKTFNNSPFIYFPYDIRSNCYKNLDEALRLGIPKMEISAEKCCFEKSDGIIHKSDKNELKALNKEVLGNIKINCPTLYFFPYCLKKFFTPINEKEKLSKKDKNIHLVYVGHVPFDEGWIDGVEQLSKQKIYLHLYSKTVNLSQLEEENRIKRSLNKVIDNKYLKIHKAVSQELLSKEISKYDYGMYSYSTKEETNAAMATGNKLASYMEAGLPIICPEWYKSTAKIIKGYKIGLIFKPHQFNFLKDTIKKSNYKKLQRNILKTREELCMENQFPRLLEFFKEVEQYHKQKKIARNLSLLKQIAPHNQIF